MKPRIPGENGDIRACVRRRIVHDITVIVAVRVIVFLPAYLYGYYTPPVNIFGVIFVEVICLVPFFAVRIWKWFIGARAFEGEVISVRHRMGNWLSGPKIGRMQTPTRAMSRTPVAGRSLNVVRVDIEKVKVRTADGKIRRKRYVCPPDGRIPQYEVGDRVRYYYGTEYMQKLPSKDDILPDKEKIPNICVMCGAINESDDEYCDFCGISIPDRTK